jgi:hypothetical protein
MSKNIIDSIRDKIDSTKREIERLNKQLLILQQTFKKLSSIKVLSKHTGRPRGSSNRGITVWKAVEDILITQYALTNHEIVEKLKEQYNIETNANSVNTQMNRYKDMFERCPENFYKWRLKVSERLKYDGVGNFETLPSIQPISHTLVDGDEINITPLSLLENEGVEEGMNASWSDANSKFPFPTCKKEEPAYRIDEETGKPIYEGEIS